MQNARNRVIKSNHTLGVSIDPLLGAFSFLCPFLITYFSGGYCMSNVIYAQRYYIEEIKFRFLSDQSEGVQRNWLRFLRLHGDLRNKTARIKIS